MMTATRLLAFLLLLLVSHAVVSSAAPCLPKRVALTVQAHAQRLQSPAATLNSNSQGLFSELRGAVTPAATGGPIKYNGGPVIVGNPTVNIYHIYYDSWPAGSGQDYIDNFVRSLSSDSGAQGSASDPTVKGWWAITSNYYQTSSRAKKNVSSMVRLAGTTYDNYSNGKALTDSNVLSIVKSKIGSGKAFAYDPYGIYVLISSKDVTLSSGFCSQYCGWHTVGYIGSSPLYYAFVGHHAQCPNACGVKSTSPNGNPAIDATISTLAHEITEAATDPDVKSAWFDAGGEENADLIAILSIGIRDSRAPAAWIPDSRSSRFSSPPSLSQVTSYYLHLPAAPSQAHLSARPSLSFSARPSLSFSARPSLSFSARASFSAWPPVLRCNHPSACAFSRLLLLLLFHYAPLTPLPFLSFPLTPMRPSHAALPRVLCAPCPLRALPNVPLAQFKPETCSTKARNLDTVRVHYKGMLVDGSVFDSSYERGDPLQFRLGQGNVIKGWDIGILGMCVGEKRKLKIPAHMGYGESGSPPKIPGGATLIFETELVEIVGAKPDDEL
ncbi:unnamed protein product [Closterium sp. Naga37s-1]|nr:unnamed protein product [Closterium sp. Naga37s-1]